MPTGMRRQRNIVNKAYDVYIKGIDISMNVCKDQLPGWSPTSLEDGLNSRVRRLNQISPEAKLLTGFGLAFATLIAVGTVQYRSIQVLVETDGWVAHTHAVLTELEATYSYLQRAESGTRGYVATGQNDYLTLQASGVRDSAGHFHSARRLTADNATQQRNLDKLAVLVGRKTLVMRRIVALRHDQGFAAASQELGKGEGLQLMNEIRAAVDGMEAEENRLLEIRQAGSRASARRSNAAIALGTLLALAFILAAGSISSRDALRHRRAVREREESEAAFRTLADNVPQLVWMCTPDGLNVYFNQRWVEYTGLTLQQSYGRNWSTPFHPDDRQGAWDAWNHATATGETYVVESRLRAADGNFRWFLMRGVPLHDASGVIVKWFGTCTDIDDLKRAEEALRTTTEALRQASAYNRSLIEASLDPLVTIASDGKITDVNMATEKVTGRSREELIGTDFSDYFTEPEKARAGYQQAFREGSVQDYELGIRHRDGHTTPVLYNAALYRDQAAEVVGIFAAARDITAQKQASQYARSLIEASLDPLVTISPEGKITDVNEATVKVTGVPRERLIGTDFSNYFTEPEQARSGYREVFEKGSVTDYPLTIRHRSGRLTDVLYNASVYRDAHGKVLGVFAAARDVTESRRVNRELAETKDFLDNILQSSTRYSIIGKDLNHHILSWNEGARRNYGYLAEEIIGRNATVLHSPEDVESGRVDALLKAALENGLAEGEFQRVRKDGSRFTASVVLTRRDDASGHPIGYLLMSNDISEKKRQKMRCA